MQSFMKTKLSHKVPLWEPPIQNFAKCGSTQIRKYMYYKSAKICHITVPFDTFIVDVSYLKH